MVQERIIFLDASSHFYKSACPSVGLSVPCFFRIENMNVFRVRMIIFDKGFRSHIYKRVCPSIDRLVSLSVPRVFGKKAKK